MHTHSLKKWIHSHAFGQDAVRVGEKRTVVVVVITVVTMVVEIAAGYIFGSMALLADGLHMGSHASALAISAFAYYFTRKHAHDARFNFGTGKVNTLAAFASAVLLGVFALIMGVESIGRFVHPVTISFNQAILVAVLGLAVNVVSLVILGGHGHSHTEGEAREHDEEHVHAHDEHEHGGHRRHELVQCEPEHRRDLNLGSAYLHVLADALTSVLAIGALLSGKYLGQTWLDPAMGIVGAVMVTAWSAKLLRLSARVLLDMEVPDSVRASLRESVEANPDDRVSDLHVWAVGPGIYAAEIAVVSAAPRPPDYYKGLLHCDVGLVHITVEVHPCTTCIPAATEEDATA